MPRIPLCVLTAALAGLGLAVARPADAATPTTSPTTTATAPTSVVAALLSPQTVRDALAVNIHFTTPRPGEMRLLAATGVGRVRMDVGWHHVERRAGEYDFSKYDALMRELDAAGLKAMLILDYGNALYTGDQKAAPVTPEARAAFARFAAATVAHFKGRGVLWEIYNEPNNKSYWKPAPDAALYAALAVETARAVRAVAPGEVLCGPGLAGVDLPFLQKAVDNNLLDAVDAVTVHPYRQTPPETFGDDLAQVRRMIKAHTAPGRGVPVIAGEWGYPVVWVDTPTQVNYLARQMLYGLSQRLPLNVWYDWRRGGSVEGRVAIFGLIDAVPCTAPTTQSISKPASGPATGPSRSGEVPGEIDLRPTPLYDALAALGRLLGDTHFAERLPMTLDNQPEEYLLAFDGPAGRRYALWATRDTGEVKVNLPDGVYEVFDVWGHRLGARTARRGMPYRVTGSPVYAVPAPPATPAAAPPASEPATEPATEP